MSQASDVMRSYEHIYEKYMRSIIDNSVGNEMLMTIQKDRIPSVKLGGAQRNWTDKQKEKMKKMYEGNVSIKNISLHFDCSTSTIARIVKNQK